MQPGKTLQHSNRKSLPGPKGKKPTLPLLPRQKKPLPLNLATSSPLCTASVYRKDRGMSASTVRARSASCAAARSFRSTEGSRRPVQWGGLLWVTFLDRTRKATGMRGRTPPQTIARSATKNISMLRHPQGSKQAGCPTQNFTRRLRKILRGMFRHDIPQYSHSLAEAA